MDMLEIITKKRDGASLTNDEIRWFVKGFSEGSIPDYQAAALLMAIYYEGLSDNETISMTKAMLDSGDTVDLSGVAGIKVDKHSTGGVGDKLTLIVMPIAAAAGVTVAKMSGRGLGFTGGTADKLEAIPGFRTTLKPSEFSGQVKEIGIALVTQTAMITPADKKLYALRDVTGTVENRSLIAASIMSKKLASGSDAIVLDIKCGKGAFFKNKREAKGVAELMIKIGKAEGRRMTAVISDMNEPLGFAAGNALEVIEAIDVLKGNGPSDVCELAIALAAEMILISGKVRSIDDAVEKAKALLESGAALKKFEEVVAWQGGNKEIINNYRLLNISKVSHEIISEKTGYVTAIDAEKIGKASQHSGAGRMTKEALIDYGAGVIMNKKRGDIVEKGELLLTVFGSDKEKVAEAAGIANTAYEIGSTAPKPLPIVIDIIR